MSQPGLQSSMRPLSSMAHARIFIWSAIACGVLVCALTTWVHVRNEDAIQAHTTACEELRSGRVNLARGFLYATMAGDPALPFNREQGVALLRQSEEQFKSALDSEVWRDVYLVVTNASAKAQEDFSRQLQAFHERLSAWAAPATRNPSLEADLRDAFYKLEGQASALDSALQQRLRQITVQNKEKFQIALVATVILFGIVCLMITLALRAESRARASLLEINQRGAALLEAIPDQMFLIDANGQFIDYHAPDASKLYRPPTEFIGRNVADVLPPELATQVMREVRQILSTREGGSFEYSLHVPDGECFFEARVRPCGPNAGLFVVRDITAQRNALIDQARRLQLEEQLSNLAATAPGVIHTYRISAEGHGSFPYANNRIEEIYGYTPEALAKDASVISDRVHPDDLHRVSKSVRESAEQLAPWICEYRYDHPSRGEIWIEGRSMPHREPDGSTLWQGFLFDITERKRTDHDLRRSSEMLQRIGDIAKIGGWSLEMDPPRLWWSEQVYRIHEVDPSTRVDVDKAIDFYAPEARPLIRAAVEAGFREGTPWDIELPLITAKGRRIWVRAQGVVEQGNGKVVRLFGAFQDITERRRAEESIRQSEMQFRQMAENIEEVFWLSDPSKQTVLYVSPAYESIWGRSPESLRTNSTQWLDSIHPEDRDRVWHAARTEQAAGKYDEEYRVIRPDGSERWIRDRAFPIRNELGEVYRIAGIAADVTEQKELDRIIEERLILEERLSNLAATVPGAIYTFRLAPDGRMCFPYASPKMEELFPLEAEQLLRDAASALALIHPGDITAVNASIAQSAASLSPWTSTFRIRHPKLGVIWIEGRSIPEREADGGTLWYGFLLDVTQRKAVELELERQRLQLKGIIDSAMDGIITIDERQRIAVFNSAAERMFRKPSAEVIGQTFETLLPERFRSTHEGLVGQFGLEVITNRPMGIFGTICGQRSDGEEFPIEASVSRIELEGRSLFTVTCRDVSERKQAEENRLMLEEQLRQAQKMEAIGTLAGGIAHDFNNILGAILGNIELARMDTPDDHPVAECLEEIRKAGLRAKNLVQQILTFSRQQSPERRVISLEPVIDEAFGLLRATLPAGIQLKRRVAGDTPRVLADANQIHQLLLNVCTNAWHAIDGEGGQIEIELNRTQFDEPPGAKLPELGTGPHVELVIRDNGHGMDEATLQRVFEPFFTTKAPGKGTGLGLSVVHGIVRSHQGAIQIRSKPADGTVIRVYFPAAGNESEPAATMPLERFRGAGQSLLYIDDEEPLVQLAINVFSRLGYHVTGFAESIPAVAEFRRNPGKFDIVITDLNMPGSSGLKVASELLEIRPELPVVLTSGFITDDLRETARQAGVRHVVYKPNTVDELCATIHTLLTESPQP